MIKAKTFYKTLANNPLMEFHIAKSVRERLDFNELLFASSGNIVFANFKEVREFTQKANELFNPLLEGKKMLKASHVNAMALIDEIFHYVCFLFRNNKNKKAFEDLYTSLEKAIGEKQLDALLLTFVEEFPPMPVYKGKQTAKEYFEGSNTAEDILVRDSKQKVQTDGIAVQNKITVLEEFILLHLANENPAFEPFLFLFSNKKLQKMPAYTKAWDSIQSFFEEQPFIGPNNTSLIQLFKEPVIASPLSLKGQLDYIRSNWTELLGEWLLRLLSGIDFLQEEDKPGWSGHFSGPPPMEAYDYNSLLHEYERFSQDKDWMPRVVLMAKTVLVWLDQLTKKYNRPITRLDQIPDEELDILAQQGFTGLWLIGIWERSWGSKRIKQINGNPEAAASAYSLHDYDIAEDLGGWDALGNLRTRLWYRGIRLASDMVPNHTGLDSKWLVEKPHLFLQAQDCPFPTYSFNGENLSLDPRISVYLEDNYYNKSDCAVVYKRVDNATGDTKYIYHGNDGTGLPWNDTAQVDFLNPEAREEVIQKILHVARNFPIIRFDAAMVLAKKHIRRLWYPEPGHGGDIASRAEHAISHAEFEKRIPNEFWREVVDRCAAEVPDTLLLAEAFWMMEGYFVRTLGMHRVYNSAFMNMLKKEENFKYRATVKNTLEFDPQVLKRFVNFMNNPDEETALAQFGKDDKYFGVCTLMVTMPGLPMFGHGQIEGFSEKYGMEYTKAYYDEKPDMYLIERHEREIFPLVKKRFLFSEVEQFRFYDVWNNGEVNENIFAYSNSYKSEKSLVFYNNKYERASGWIKESSPYAEKKGEEVILHTENIANALGLSFDKNSFCIFQELKTGLWYIRSSKEIHEKGIYVSLNGFASQVLLNICEIKDDETGKWALLHHHLEGRGVQDIEVALTELFLRDLYKSLETFASKEFFDNLGELFEVGKIDKKKVKAILSDSKKAGLLYYKTLVDFIEGNYGFASIINKKDTGKSLDAEIVWDKFEKRILNLMNFVESAQAKTAKDSKLKALAAFIYDGILATPYMGDLLVAYAILYSVRDLIGEKASAWHSKELINLWCLDRKIRDLLVEYGRPSKDLYQIFKTFIEVTRFSDYPIIDEELTLSAYLFVQAVLETNEASIILGANSYADVLWLQKEKTEFSFWAAIVLYALFTAEPKDYERLLSLYAIAMKALNDASYKADSFVSYLAPKDTKAAKEILSKNYPKDLLALLLDDEDEVEAKNEKKAPLSSNKKETLKKTSKPKAGSKKEETKTSKTKK